MVILTQVQVPQNVLYFGKVILKRHLHVMLFWYWKDWFYSQKIRKRHMVWEWMHTQVDNRKVLLWHDMLSSPQSQGLGAIYSQVLQLHSCPSYQPVILHSNKYTLTCAARQRLLGSRNANTLSERCLGRREVKSSLTSGGGGVGGRGKRGSMREWMILRSVSTKWRRMNSSSCHRWFADQAEYYWLPCQQNNTEQKDQQ